VTTLPDKQKGRFVMNLPFLFVPGLAELFNGLIAPQASS